MRGVSTGVETVLDVSALAPDLATIDVLARLRRRRPLRLRGASKELRELIAFCGLESVLPVENTQTIELGGEP